MASVRISRTPASGGNRKTFTFSAWIKRANLEDTTQTLLMAGDSNGNNNISVLHLKDNQIEFYTWVGSYQFQVTTNRVLRDTSAFYHIVVAVDTTQGTAADRVKIYVNGTQETSFANSSYPSQNYDTFINHTVLHGVANYNAGSSQYFSGCMAHVHFTDGTAYAASTFGETDSTSGIWKPKTAPSVTYGTNGFFLKFENSGNLDLDSSGNNLTFTTSGTLTQNVDTPSNVFACWNPQINTDLTGNWSNANLSIAPNGDNVQLYAPITFPLSKGKWYSEHMITGGNGYGSIGLSGASYISNIFITGEEPGLTSPSFAFRCINGGIKMNNANTSYGSAPGTSDAILGMAVDIDNKKVWYHINGTYVTYGGGVGDPAGGNYGFDWSSLSDDFGWLHVCGDSETNGYGNWKSNFGSGFFGTTAVASANADANGFGAFEYAVPSGYYSICTKNIKEFG